MSIGMPVESPARGDVHARVRRGVGETDRPKGRHRAPARPYVFRFNRRRSRSRGLVFHRVLELAAAHEPVRHRELIANPGGRAGTPRTPPGTRGHPASLDRPQANRPWRAATTQPSG
jgi:hypothetical protein